MARASAEAYVKARADLAFPLLRGQRAETAKAAFDANIESGVNAASLAAARAARDFTGGATAPSAEGANA